MLKVREGQIDALRDDLSERVLPAEVVEIIGEMQPELLADLSPHERERRVRLALASTQRFGLELIEERMRLAALMLRYSPLYERHPALGAIAADSARTPSERLQALEDQVPVFAWIQSRALWGDDKAWDTLEAAIQGRG